MLTRPLISAVPPATLTIGARLSLLALFHDPHRSAEGSYGQLVSFAVIAQVSDHHVGQFAVKFRPVLQVAGIGHVNAIVAPTAIIEA